MRSAVLDLFTANDLTFTAPSHVIDTASLRVLPLTNPYWLRAIAKPNVAHLQETEDGQPREVQTDGRRSRVAPAPCRTLLSNLPVLSLRAEGLTICLQCRGIAELIHGVNWARCP
jgi:hypothetical protein